MTDELKLIEHTGEGKVPDDPSYPYKVEIVLGPPEFMRAMYVMLHGGVERIVVRATTREALEGFLTQTRLRTHLRLHRLTITGPDGVLEQVDRLQPQSTAQASP